MPKDISTKFESKVQEVMTYAGSYSSRMRSRRIGAIIYLVAAVMALVSGLANGSDMTIILSTLLLLCGILYLVDIKKTRTAMKELDPEQMVLKNNTEGVSNTPNNTSEDIRQPAGGSPKPTV